LCIPTIHNISPYCYFDVDSVAYFYLFTPLVRKTTLRIDSQFLKPWIDRAEVLGITVGECLEEWLAPYADKMGKEGFESIAKGIVGIICKTRQDAEEIAQRFNASLIGWPNLGTVATRVVKLTRGKWTIKINHRKPSAKGGWRSISIDN
jgi:hypothetical protein